MWKVSSICRRENKNNISWLSQDYLHVRFFIKCIPLSEGWAVTRHQVLINQGLRHELLLLCLFFFCMCGYTYMLYVQACGGVGLWLQSGDWMIHMRAPIFFSWIQLALKKISESVQSIVKPNVQLMSNSADGTWMVWMRNHFLPLTRKYFRPLMQKKCLFPFNGVPLPWEMNMRVLRPSMKVNAFWKKEQN